MATTQVERLLLYCLKMCGVAQDEAVGTVLFLNTEQQIALIKWIASEKRPTEQEIMAKVVEMISSRKHRETGDSSESSEGER